MTPYAGKLLDGDAEFRLTEFWHQPGFFWTFSSHNVRSNWAEAVTSWTTFVGPTTDDTYLATIDGVMDTVTIDAAGTFVWVVSNDVVQNWIDTPADNKGVALVGSGNTCVYSRHATWRPDNEEPNLTFQIQSLNNPPNTPTNKSPLSGTMRVPRDAPLEGTAFVDPDGDGHGASEWQVATDPGFNPSAIEWDSGRDTANLTMVTTPTLAYNSRYWWRVRYQDDPSNGAKWSEYSDPTWFDTEFNLIDPVQKDAVGMAQIWPAGPDSNINSRSSIIMNLVNPVTNVAPAGFIMMQFDLGVFNSFTGSAVQGDGTIDIGTVWTDENFPPSFGIHPLLQPWTETNVTWNNYIGGDWSAWTNLVGPQMDFQVIDTIGVTARFTVSEALIQSWINSPASNFGVALVPDATGNTSWRSSPKPLLTFDLVNTNAIAPDKPVNQIPADGTKDVGLVPTLTASDYSGGGTHAASQWRIARDMAMTDVAWDSGADSANLTSISVPSNNLAKSVRYYWDVRYINLEGGKSEYSDPTSFDTEVETGCRIDRPSQNAMVKPNADQIFSNFNGAVDTILHPQGGSNGVLGGIILAKFNLGVFEGLDADGDATFTIQYDFVDQAFGDIFFTCYEALAPWNEATATWENYVGGSNVMTVLGQSFGSSLAVEYETSVWTISEATIQKWLDNGETNFGLAIYPDQGNANAFIRSRAVPARAPTLEYCVIPEPGMLAGLALAAFALLRQLRG
jgi:hypothetical protein